MSKSSYYTFLVIAVLLVAAGIFYYFSRPVTAPTTPVDKSTSTVSGLPEGVSVVDENGEKVLVNKLDNYNLKLNKETDSVSYEGGMLSIKEQSMAGQGDASLVPSYDVTFFDRNGVSAEDWVKTWIRKQEYSKDYSYNTVVDKENKLFVVSVPGYGNLEQILIFENKDKIVFIDGIGLDVLKVYRDIFFK